MCYRLFHNLVAQFNHLPCANKYVLTLKLSFILETEGRLGGTHNFCQNLKKGKKPFNLKKKKKTDAQAPYRTR